MRRGTAIAVDEQLVAEAMAACVMLDHLLLDRAQTGGVRGRIG